jgi:hypothetical protein
MEYRAPSTLAAVDGVLRRRSSVYVPHNDEGEDAQNPNTSADDSYPEHTVLLVRRAPASSPLQGLPWLPSRSASSLFSGSVDTRAPSPLDTLIPSPGEPERPFSPVPLTPRLDTPQRIDSDASFPLLPTPDFARQPPRFLSFLPRGLSFLSQTPRPLFSRASSSDDTRRPQSVRSDSQGSSTASLDSGHHALIKSIGTTDRFTHKWPRPQSLRDLNLDSDDAASLALLEDGRGLGTDKAEPWTGFKWCLLFSVCTVFAYGAAGLVCALTTWFRSKLFLSPAVRLTTRLTVSR